MELHQMCRETDLRENPCMTEQHYKTTTYHQKIRMLKSKITIN